MNDTYVTIRGWIGGEPRLYENKGVNSENGSPRATTIFRVGVTPRYFSRRENQYTDGVTTWYSVRCYGTLATHASLSLAKGMPVLVRGRLITRMWRDKNDEQQPELAIIADSVGVELSNGIASYTKRTEMSLRPQPGEPGWTGNADEPAMPAQGWNGTEESAGDGIAVDEDGVVIEDEEQYDAEAPDTDGSDEAEEDAS